MNHLKHYEAKFINSYGGIVTLPLGQHLSIGDAMEEAERQLPDNSFEVHPIKQSTGLAPESGSPSFNSQ